jgi:hypothetical protein
MNEMFIRAAKLKLRFPSPAGLLAVENLFDLPLTSKSGRANLDDIAKGLYATLKSDVQVSFVDDKPQENTVEQLAFDIVKYVIDIKKAERTAAAVAAERALTRQKIMAMIDQKKDAAMGEKSVEDLQAMLASLG